MTLQEKLAELKADTDVLAVDYTVRKLKANLAIVVMEIWEKRTAGNRKQSDIVKDRYLVTDYGDPDNEEIWQDRQYDVSNAGGNK